MTQSLKNTFIIDHIDPLGQGVYKEKSDIFFIPKTLPGETGTFNVIKSAKGVHFAEIEALDKVSPDRIKSQCPHYNKCNGCAYLHTELDHEHNFKKQHLQRMLTLSLNNTTKIDLITNSKRFHYRNRVQLHYHKKSKSLGFMARKSKHIISINNCLLADLKIQEKLLELTDNDSWIDMIPHSEPGFGHVEILLKEGNVSLHWNKQYAFGGFSQVNSPVNNLFLQEVQTIFNDQDLKILDLFGGGGNLVNTLRAKTVMSVDLYSERDPKKNQKHLDLFQTSALSEFQRDNKTNYDTLFVDPPRSGFANLDQWTQAIKPNHLLYVSCHPATMVRDLAKITHNYDLQKVYLLDFFPSTHHFESAVYLTKKA